MKPPLKKKNPIFSTLFLLFNLSLFAFGFCLPALAAVVIHYDFIHKAPEAKWFSHWGPGGTLTGLPWNGNDNDKRGFARQVINKELENGQTYPLVLETHPEWKKNGIISGVYSDISIPENASFKAAVGFLKGAASSDGVIFQVRILEQASGTARTLATVKASYDGTLDEMAIDLKDYAGKKVSFTLYVSAAGHSTQDWAVWAYANISSATPLPAQPTISDKSSHPKVQAIPKAQATSSQQTGQQATTISGLQVFKPLVVKRIPLNPAGAQPPRHKIEDIGPLPIEEPLTIHNHVYQDNEKPNTFYFLPRQINLIRDQATGGYRISAVWTKEEKIRTTLSLQANIDPQDVRVMEEALKKAKGAAATLRSMPYDQAEIIDLKGWEDWEIEDIRLPTFGSLEAELPISISMTPDTLAQLKPLLEKEGLAAGLHLKTGDVEREIPIKIGLKYFTGRLYSGIEELGYSFDEASSILTLHWVRNLTDFPLKVSTVSLRFRLPNGEETYKGLNCVEETVIPPGEARDLKVRFVPRGLLLAEYRQVFPSSPQPPQKKSTLLDKGLEILKEQIDKKRKEETGKEEEPPAKTRRSEPVDPRLDTFFKNYAYSFWMEVVPDFDCQPCLEKVWNNIEVVSYINRMRRISVEILANVFEPSDSDPPLEVEKIHLDIRSPYLSPQPQSGLLTGLDFNKDKLKETVLVYLPSSSEEQFSFEYKIKVVLKSGESAASDTWEVITDSLDVTIGTFHIKIILGK